MIVGYKIFKNYLIDFDKEIFLRGIKKNVESSLNHVKKYTACDIRFSLGGSLISDKLFLKARYTEADLLY